jgi:hypothetical protein
MLAETHQGGVMKRALTPLSLIGIALAMLLFAAACICTSNGDVLTIEEYFTQLEAADQAASDAFDAVNAGLSENPTLEEVQGAYPDLLTAADTFLADVEDLNPPTAVEDAHNDFVDTLGIYTEELSNSLDAMQEATSLEEAGQVFGEEYNAAVQGFDEACLAVQAEADERQIDMTLGCAEDGTGGAQPTPSPTP